MSQSTPLVLKVAVVLSLLAAGLPAQSLWHKARRKSSPTEDMTARTVGDILTIVVREDHRTKAQDKTDRKQDTSLSAALKAYTIDPKTFGSTLPEIDLEGRKVFKGESRQERDQAVQARIAVFVSDVLPNGNMVVAGRREILVDDERRTLRISGVVRPRDISASNTVQSDQVADARVAIEATGPGRQHTTRGPVANLVHSAIWFIWPF